VQGSKVVSVHVVVGASQDRVAVVVRARIVIVAAVVLNLHATVEEIAHPMGAEVWIRIRIVADLGVDQALANVP
jgi:hypothetical protein